MLYSSPYILAIESSCDDTAAAVLKGRQVLSNCIANQSVHKAYGGVVPELASRAHQSNIVPVVEQALKKAKINKHELNAIGYTQGPGLMGSLLVGNAFAKSLSLGLQIPLLDVHHMQAHLLVHFIDDPRVSVPEFPFIGVTLSGGHTQLVWVENHLKMSVIGSTLDDAIGEAFDKCGKVMDLAYPAGPEIDRLAQTGNPHRFDFPIPKVAGYDVSYSGVKTAFLNFINRNTNQEADFIEKNRNDLCASLQKTLIQIILLKIEQAVTNRETPRVVIGGGVSANSEMRKQLQKLAQEKGWSVHLPPLEYTTDNAAMIGITAYFKYQNELFGNLKAVPKARLAF